MPDAPRSDPLPTADPLATPVPRRRVLVLMGAGVLAAGGGLGTFLAACSAPPVTVALDVDPATLEPGVPTEVPFTVPTSGWAVPASTWLVLGAAGDLVAFDPRCTHARCAYRWLDDDARFQCDCHDGRFAVDGTVLGGPPPRPLDRFPLRIVDGVVEIDVPADLSMPRGESAS